MALLCAISGATPEQPVVTRDGYVFEKRLIEKHLEIEGTCPVTGGMMTADDLIPLKASRVAKPRPTAATSIPSLLTLFQNEWDSLMTETYQLRKHLDQVRQQLSHALYQHDAACRVIARVIRERDAARSRASQLEGRLASAHLRVEGPAADIGVSEDLINRISSLAKELLTARRKRVLPETTTSDQLRGAKIFGSWPLHSTTPPGVTCVAVDAKTPTLIATGGVDGTGVLFDVQKQKTICKLVGHTRKINRLALHPSLPVAITASDDRTARVWVSSTSTEGEVSYRVEHKIRRGGEVVDLHIHPMGEHFVTAAKDKTWGLHDIQTGATLLTKTLDTAEYNTIAFHPDGLILGGGNAEGGLCIWDVKSQEEKAVLPAHGGAVKRIAFSENGFYLASCGADGLVKLWDLRKSATFQTISIGEGPVNSVAFDNSGAFLAVSSSDPVVRLFHLESKTQMVAIADLEGHEGPVTDVQWGAGAAFLVSTSADRFVKLWRPAV